MHVLYLAPALLTAGIFLLDLAAGPVYAPWLLYFLPLLLIARTLRQGSVIGLMALCTVLIFLAPVIKDYPASSMFRRFLGTAILWTTAWLLVTQIRGEKRLRETVVRLERARAEAEEKGRILDALMEYVPEGLAVTDENLTFRMMSRYGTEMVGRRSEEIRRAGYEEPSAGFSLYRSGGTAPVAREELPLVRAVTSGEAVKDQELLIRRPDGEEVPILCNAAPIRNRDGRIAGGIIAWRDITKRKRNEDILRETTETLRAIVEGSPLAVIVLDPEGKVFLWNPAAERTFGWKEEEVLARRVPTVPEDLKGVFDALFRQAFAGERFDNLEARGICKDGSQVHLLISTAPLRNAQGAIYANLGVFTDITGRKRAERALKESEERFRTLVEHSLVGFFIVQEDRTVYMNPEQRRIFGLPRKDAGPGEVGLKDLEANVHPADLGKLRECCAALHSGEAPSWEGTVRFYPYRMPHEDRNVRWVNVRAVPVVYRGEAAVLANMADITESKEMERIVLVQEKMATLGHMAAGVAHEIRNPLSGINIYLDSLGKLLEESEGLEPENKEMARVIGDLMRSASGKIEGVIRRVMDFARPSPARLSPVPINRAVQEAADLAAVALRRNGVGIELGLADGLPLCRADLHLIEQVILNLVMNADQAMEGQEGPKRIAITSALEKGYVVVRVSDSGSGVPLSMRERIFEPYYTTKSGGTGLGLAFSRRVVMDHGGFIEVGTSRLGGAEFRIGIPAGNERRGSAAA